MLSAGSSWDEWQAAARAMGGVATTWPFVDDGHAGEPAARFDLSTYTLAYNTGGLPSGDGTRVSSSGQSIYVLGQAMTGGTNVVATSPHVMTFAERAANNAFLALDHTAGALGLPSLPDVHDWLTGVGKEVAWAAGLAVLAYVVVKRVTR